MQQSVKGEEMMKEDLNHADLIPEKDDMKPGGMIDGIMKEEAKTEVKNRRISEDPSTLDDVLQEEHEKKQK